MLTKYPSLMFSLRHFNCQIIKDNQSNWIWKLCTWDISCVSPENLELMRILNVLKCSTGGLLARAIEEGEGWERDWVGAGG